MSNQAGDHEGMVREAWNAVAEARDLPIQLAPGEPANIHSIPDRSAVALQELRSLGADAIEYAISRISSPGSVSQQTCLSIAFDLDARRTVEWLDGGGVSVLEPLAAAYATVAVRCVPEAVTEGLLFELRRKTVDLPPSVTFER